VPTARPSVWPRYYQSHFGKFATTLTELGLPNNGQPGPSSADIIPGGLAKGEKSQNWSQEPATEKSDELK